MITYRLAIIARLQLQFVYHKKNVFIKTENANKIKQNITVVLFTQPMQNR